MFVLILHSTKQKHYSRLLKAKNVSVHWVMKQRSDPSAHTASRRRVEASAMDASCSEGPVTSRNNLTRTGMDLPQTENVHNTALGAHWAQVTRSNLILTTSNRRHACATLTVARPWAHGPVLRAAALAEAIFVTRGRAPSGPVRRLCVHGSMVIRALVRAWCDQRGPAPMFLGGWARVRMADAPVRAPRS